MSTTASVVDLTSFPDVAWANQGQLCQSRLRKEKMKATPKTKSWERLGKLFEKLGAAFIETTGFADLIFMHTLSVFIW